MNMPGFTAEVSIYTTANRYSGSVAGITETGSGAAFVLSTSQHGLDDSDTIGSHGYDIHSRGEAFIQGSWPTSAVWQNPNLWGVCDDTHCDGSFSIRTEWPVCRIEKNVNICEPKIGFTTVTVKGVYDRAGWDVREGFMNDLFAHHFGNGGVYHNGDFGWGNGFGYPPGWWVASNTWIRHSGSGFWVNIQINETR